jgi:hypothetical protein
MDASHTPLSWYEQESESYQAHFGLPSSADFLRLSSMEVG